jgi:hypothetical protein
MRMACTANANANPRLQRQPQLPTAQRSPPSPPAHLLAYVLAHRYVAADMAAKFLLLFVYIASVNNHSTVDNTLDAPPSRTTSEREIARARASVVGRATAAESAAGGNGTAAVQLLSSRHGHGIQPLEADGMGCRSSSAVQAQTVVGTRVA